MAKRRSSSQRRVVVKFVSQTTGKSGSLTVYGASFDEVARYTERRLRELYTTTSLTDSRHKRRS